MTTRIKFLNTLKMAIILPNMNSKLLTSLTSATIIPIAMDGKYMELTKL